MKKLMALLMILCLCVFVAGCPSAVEPVDDTTPAVTDDNGDGGAVDEGTTDEGTTDEATIDEGTTEEGTAEEGTAEDDELKIPEPELDLNLE
jgi:hypothetical protein